MVPMSYTNASTQRELRMNIVCLHIDARNYGPDVACNKRMKYAKMAFWAGEMNVDLTIEGESAG